MMRATSDVDDLAVCCLCHFALAKYLVTLVFGAPLQSPYARRGHALSDILNARGRQSGSNGHSMSFCWW